MVEKIQKSSQGECQDPTITFTQGFIINVHHLSSLHNQYNMSLFAEPLPPPKKPKKQRIIQGPVAEGKSEKHYSESRKIVNETGSQTVSLFLLHNKSSGAIGKFVLNSNILFA
jgi:hypothetical protein